MDEFSPQSDAPYVPDVGREPRVFRSQRQSGAYSRLVQTSAVGLLAATLAACGAGEEATISPTGPAVSSSTAELPATSTAPAPEQTAVPTTTGSTTNTPEKPKPTERIVPDVLKYKLGYFTITDEPLSAKADEYHAKQEALVDKSIKTFEQGAHGKVDLEKKDVGEIVISIDPTKRRSILDYGRDEGFRVQQKEDVVTAELAKLEKAGKLKGLDGTVVSLQITDFVNGSTETNPDGSSITRGATFEYNHKPVSVVFENPQTEQSEPDGSVYRHELGHWLNRVHNREANKYLVDEANGLECTDILLRPGGDPTFNLTQKALNSCKSIPLGDNTTGMGHFIGTDNKDFYGGGNEIQTGMLASGQVAYIDGKTPGEFPVELHKLAENNTEDKKVLMILLPNTVRMPFIDNLSPQETTGHVCVAMEYTHKSDANGNALGGYSVKTKISHCDVVEDKNGNPTIMPYGQTFLLRNITLGDPGNSHPVDKMLTVGGITVDLANVSDTANLNVSVK